MRRLMHRLLRRHRFERFELTSADIWVSPRSGEVTWYVGFRCTICGDPGYPVPVR